MSIRTLIYLLATGTFFILTIVLDDPLGKLLCFIGAFVAFVAVNISNTRDDKKRDDEDGD